MQTTLRINDGIYREAKTEAARSGMTLTRFIEDSLRRRLNQGANSPAGPEERKRREREIGEFAGKYGVDLTGFKFNREELYDRGLS